MRIRRMNHTFWGRIAVCIGGASLLSTLGGCEPGDAGILQEFVTDFARSVLAAWLL